MRKPEEIFTEYDETTERIAECLTFLNQDTNELERFAQFLPNVEAFRLGQIQHKLEDMLAEVEVKNSDLDFIMRELKTIYNGQIPMGEQPQ